MMSGGNWWRANEIVVIRHHSPSSRTRQSSRVSSVGAYAEARRRGQEASSVIRLVVMMYERYPLSLRNVEDLLAERGIDVSYETVRFWWNRFGPMFAAEIRKKRLTQTRCHSEWCWHLDEVFVRSVSEDFSHNQDRSLQELGNRD
jgi:hypothetical protein